jgi:hypothetical protein
MSAIDDLIIARLDKIEAKIDAWLIATGQQSTSIKHHETKIQALENDLRYWIRWTIGILAATMLSAVGTGLLILLKFR